jgi:hypothetical protein
MGINKIIEGGLGIIKSAGRTAHEQEAAIRAAQNAKVAEQMANLPPRNKKANEALGLYHPVGGGIKLSKPVSGMHATTVPDPKFKPPKIGTISPEQMVKEEAAIIPLVGDRAAAGRYLTHVGENELETPVRLTGGARYMDANYNPVSPDESAAWESGAGRISALAAQAGRAGEGGRPVYGMYVAGSGTNTDFNVMGANALLQQIPFSKITKKSEKAFDQAMKEGSKAFPPIPNWPGIRSPLAQEMILDKSNGILRTKLFGTMGKEEFQSMGFPEVPGTRKAIIEPELLDVPTNQAGFRMARMDTSGRIIEDPIIPSDYPKAWAGQVAGKFDEPTDYKDIWQTHHEARRLMGDKAPASGDYYSFSRAHPIQYADQQWLDKLLQQRFANERKIKEGEYKKGGEVDMPNDVDLTESDKKLHALIDRHRLNHALKSGGKVESKIEGDDPDAKLHALIEARRKELHAAKGGGIFDTTEPKPIGFDKGGAAFGVFPQLKGKRSKQDPEAAKNVPVDVARGFVSGVLGMPGDLESLVRIPYDYLRSPTMSELVTGEKKSKTFAPTSEDIEKKLPFKSDTPVSRAATGAGQLAGGFYNGPGSPLKVMLNLPKAIKHGATEFAKASAAGAPRVMKPEGGNWIPGEVEKALKHLKRKTISDTDPAEVLKTFNETYTPKALEGMYEGSRQQLMEFKDVLERDVALNKWVDNNLSNYIKKQMGTEKDPVRLLADEGITHYPSEGAMRNAMNTSYQQFVENRKLRGKLGMPEQPKAKTDLGRAWEEGVDSLLDQGNMVSPKQLKGGNIYRDNPWLQKLPPDSTLYRLDRPSVDDMNMMHIMDVLREDLVTGRIKPSDLKNISIDRAVRRTHEYNQEMAKAQEAAKAKKLEGMPVYKEYPNGYKWVKLEKPGDFAAESDAMGHSVRGYEPPKNHPDWVEGSGDRGTPSYGLGGWEAIKSGKAQVYSLVDPKGNPHATIEAGAVGRPRYEEIRNHFDEAHEQVVKEMKAQGMDTSDPTKANGLAWKRAEEIAREKGYQFVNQIKGKGNDRPINKYDPYTQDFVTSGDWTEVRDLQNTGLKLVGEAFPRRDDQLGFQQLFPEQRYVTSDEVNAFRTKADQDLIDQYKDWKSKVDFEDPQFKDYEGPEFISNEEYFKRYFPDDPAAQADFIRGGKDSPSMIPPERLGMKDWDTLMNEGVFSYDDVSFLNKVMPQRYLTAEDIAKAKARLEEPPLAEKSGGLIGMANGGAMRMPPKKTEGYEEEAPKGQSFSDRLDWAMKEARKVPTSPLGSFLNVGYEGYKYFTGKDPVGDFQKELNRRLHPKMDTGSEPVEKFEKFANGGMNMAPGGLIRNLLKMTPKEEALSKLPQMKKEVAANQALEAEYRKAMRDVPYDKQVTLKDWQATQKKPAKKTVWHGSPHHFKPTEKNPLGVFDPTKIGTGEGTQAFGHGHYLAEAKGNAEGYRHMLSVDPSQGSENIKFATLENFMPNEAPAVQKQIKDFLDGTGNYADFVRVIKQQGSEDFKKALVSEEPEMFKAGALYQVELPEEQLANMLDYDLPWTQQPEAVKKALNVEGLQKFYNSDDLPVSQILHHAHQSMTPPQFAEFMRSRGIPGIKYKDAQSRGIREAEEGTRNIVIFPGNEDLLNIVGKEKRGGLIHTRKQYA